MSTSLRRQKWSNAVLTGGIAASMLILVYFLARALVGGLGVIALMFGVALLALQIFRNPSRLAGVIELDRDNAAGLLELTRRLSDRAELPRTPTLYLVPTPMPNAFTYGSRDNAHIFVTHGLVDRIDEREMAGVLAHEMSHIQHNDLLLFRFAELVRQTTTLMSRLGWLLLLFAVPIALVSGAGFPIGLLAALIGAPLVSLILQLALFRTREFGADLGAVELTGDPEGLASALYKIDHPRRDIFSLFFPIPRREESPLFRTHPATDDRIRRLRKLSSRRHSPVYR